VFLRYLHMIEQSTENSFSQDTSVKKDQGRSQNGDKLHQRAVTDDMLPTVNQLSKQIKELDKKNTRIEELISSIKRDIKNAVMMLETNHQIASDGSARIKEFHDEISRLQMQTQKIEQAISGVYESNNSKKDKKEKKLSKKEKKLSNKDKDKDKKNKKKVKSMKKKKKQK
jgi:chromosome segregation ATPase